MTRPAQVVLGPGTFINESVGQIQDEIVRRQQATKAQAARAAAAARKVAKANGWSKERQDAVARQASELVTNQFYRDVLRLGQTYGLSGIPQLNDPSFVAKLVFDSTKAPGTPKARFAYLFPTKDAALIQVRLRPDLTQSQRAAALRLIRQAVAMPDWRLPHGKGTYVVTGGPVVLTDLARSITDSIVVLVLAALLVMALVLVAAAALACLPRRRAPAAPRQDRQPAVGRKTAASDRRSGCRAGRPLRPQHPQSQRLLHPPRHLARLGTPAREIVGPHRAGDGAAGVLRHHEALQRARRRPGSGASQTGVP